MIRIVRALNTEKTYKLREKNIYTFVVPRDAKKDSVKKLVEKVYSVKIDSIRILNMPINEKSFRGVDGRTTKYKKVYVTVAKGMKIELDSDKMEASKK